MTYPMLPVEPDAAVSVNSAPKLRKISFGGYNQVGPASINNDPETWSLGYSKCKYRNVAAVYELMKERNGWQVFTWTNPQGQLKKFRCETYGLSYPHGIDPALPAQEQIVELTLQIVEEFR